MYSFASIKQATECGCRSGAVWWPLKLVLPSSVTRQQHPKRDPTTMFPLCLLSTASDGNTVCVPRQVFCLQKIRDVAFHCGACGDVGVLSHWRNGAQERSKVTRRRKYCCIGLISCTFCFAHSIVINSVLVR